MRRLMMIAFALVLLLCTAQAEELPEAVRRLCKGAYPGYAVLAMDGYDDGIVGQWAVVLHKDGDNALVLAERSEGSGYSLMVNNPNAVPDEGESYSKETHTVDVMLTKELRNDRVAFLELTIEQPGYTRWVITSELQIDGTTWSNVISDYTLVGDKENTVWWSHVFAEDSSMNYMRHAETPEGNPLRTDLYPRVPVSGESGEMHLLDRFDAGSYPYMPDLINGERLEDYAWDRLGNTATLKQLSLKPDQLVLLSENAYGDRMLHIIPWINNQYHGAMLAGPLPEGASMDLFHAGDDELILQWYGDHGDRISGFESIAAGTWRMKWTMGEENLRFEHNSIACTDDAASPMRNDGVYYGEHPWQIMTDIDFSRIPATIHEALASLDQSGYAVVSNPNPEDRLHLRELPRKDARSLGKFYNRTPVRVYSIEGEWAYVSIGSISGWMMTKYLTFGEEMESVKCAFPQMLIKEEYDSLPLQPWKEGKTVGHIDRKTAFYIVGVDEERYVILTEDGKTGYVKQSHFYPGHG